MMLAMPMRDDMPVDACKRGWVAPFLLHLHQMLRRESPQIIRWTLDGKAFEILDKKTMTEKILPKYFRNKNFASFQRQLNYFGFRKWSKSRAMYSTYSREHFTRDNFDDLVYVKRQSKSNKKVVPKEDITTDKSDVDMESDASPIMMALPSPKITPSSPMSPHSVSFMLSNEEFDVQEVVNKPPLPFNTLFSVPALSETRQTSPAHHIRLPSLHQIVPSLSRCPSSPQTDCDSPKSPKQPKVEYNVKELCGLSAARFIRGLYDMISSDNGERISWNEDGKSFTVVNSSKLAWEALPQYFKHNKYRSFQQQLNMYGFHKSSKARASTCTYSHPLFQRGHFTDLCRIARKTSMI
ncbi:HSF-type DNA-binding protein [Thraustotheca clavata]|uniref:HSF-type DNA-binding protein n=1 Tax=Thraustotheca clavata TaxID=74557 RepID=A0A1V9ZX35_9STRA|nr:HSF-type DNA-binding protein [Thraustotheca clavata]